MKRGDIYYADLRPVVGSEQGGIRPVLIIQNDVVKFIYDNIHKDIKTIREYLISNEDKFSADYVKLAEELFNVFDTSTEAMMIIADTLWRMSFQLDKEIQFINMLLNIQVILNEK